MRGVAAEARAALAVEVPATASSEAAVLAACAALATAAPATEAAEAVARAAARRSCSTYRLPMCPGLVRCRWKFELK
eukprot:11199570-Lingulodinium_polyedra.AAC.1